MNKLNVFTGILLIIFSLFVVNLNIKRYKSFEFKRIINADHIFQNPLNEKSLDFINSIERVTSVSLDRKYSQCL